MKPGDRVFLHDNRGRIEGVIERLSRREDSTMVIVKWDSGMTERIVSEELTLVEDPA